MKQRLCVQWLLICLLGAGCFTNTDQVQGVTLRPNQTIYTLMASEAGLRKLMVLQGAGHQTHIGFTLPHASLYNAEGAPLGQWIGYRPAIITDLDSVFIQRPAPQEGIKCQEALQNMRTFTGGMIQTKHLAPADFTMIVFWAEWSESSKRLLEKLYAYLAGHPNLNINVVKVEADLLKIRQHEPQPS